MHADSLFRFCKIQVIYLLFPVFKGFIRSIHKIAYGFYLPRSSALHFSYIRLSDFIYVYF